MTLPERMERNHRQRAWIIFVIWLAGILPAALHSQQPVYRFPLSQQALKTLVDSLCAQISKNYVIKEAAVKMSSQLKKKYKDGKYNNIKDPHLLAALLTNDALSVHQDEHFYVEYNPSLANEVSGNIDDVPRMVAEKLALEKMKNFGFRKAEILNGNIGYLEISSFSRLNEYSKAAADVSLKMLANANAIIIDLRYGVGGSPEMVTYILSHFFKARTHVNDIYIRNENVTLQYWTTPDSSYGALTEVPLYILTSYKTFSAAEGLSYALQSLKRATIVGETTRGGAHAVSYRPLSSGFICDMPFGRSISPVTKKNWERTGITPDIKVASDKALETAELKIFENAFAVTKDSSGRKMLKWQLDLLQSINHPFYADTVLLTKLAGRYGAYTITFDKDHLYYQKAGKAKFQLIPMNSSAFRPKGNDTFIVEFYRDYFGRGNKTATIYDDGRTEIAERTE
jgi:retinol-binding protein 3